VAASFRSARLYRPGRLSLRAQAVFEQLSYPLHLRYLTEVGQRRYFGTVAAGYVSCQFVLTFTSDGSWYISANGSANSSSPEDYLLAFFANDHQLAELRDSVNGVFNSRANGSDSWIEEHWLEIENVASRMEVTPSSSSHSSSSSNVGGREPGLGYYCEYGTCSPSAPGATGPFR
jgi:hypothetical protein